MQTVRFGLSALFGFFLFALYALCGLLRLKRRRFSLALADGVFWLAAIPAFLLFLFFLNGGQPRLYVALGAAAGFALPCAAAHPLSAAAMRARRLRIMRRKAKKLKKVKKDYLQTE